MYRDCHLVHKQVISGGDAGYTAFYCATVPE